MSEPRWNTSEGLRGFFPPKSSIPAKCWKTFATAYDAEEARAHRLTAWKAANPRRPEPSQLPERLEDLARGVLRRLNARLVFSQKPLFHEESAEKLAKIVLQLVTQKEPKALRELLQAVEERNAQPPEPRNIAAAITALTQFIRREGQLPGKKDLNVEANRILWSRRFDRHQWPGSEQRFGGSYTHGGQRLRVVEVTPRAVRACPTYEWDSPRWDSSTFSTDITKLAGLSGLPRSKRS